jgi:hypothetical protein
LATFKEGGGEEAIKSLGAQVMRMADVQDFDSKAAILESLGEKTESSKLKLQKKNQ